MRNEEFKDIQKQTQNLFGKILELWKKQGKWDGDDRSMPYYGLDKDPILSILITAFVFQTNQLEDNIKAFREGLFDEFEDLAVPFELVKPIPAIAMLATSKRKGDNDTIFTDQDMSFKIEKKMMTSSERYAFAPLFNTRLVNISPTNVKRLSETKWLVDFDNNEAELDLGSVAFFFDKLNFTDLKITIDGKEIPLIKPWEYDRFPLNPWITAKNMVCNKALVYGSNEQWFDMWVNHELNYYLIAPDFKKKIKDKNFSLTFDFASLDGSQTLDAENIILNAFPVVNVTRKDFFLSLNSPVVKISEENLDVFEDEEDRHNSFFMNLVFDEEKNEYDDLDKFTLRHFGCERFNLAELINTANTLIRRYGTDFFAFQSIPQFQSSERMRRLSYVVKDITDILKQYGLPKSGIYAILKNKNYLSPDEAKLTVCSLFTDGAAANDIDIHASIASSDNLDKKKTRLLTMTSGGKDEIMDHDEKRMLSRYYLQTNDRIVTRSDLKFFCHRILIQEGINAKYITNIDVPRPTCDDKAQKVLIHIDEDFVSDIDFVRLASKMQKMTDVRSAGLMPVEIVFSKGEAL